MSVPSPGQPAVLWFRRNLRLDDHPALVAAARQGPVVPPFVLDDGLLRTAGQPRLAYPGWSSVEHHLQVDASQCRLGGPRPPSTRRLPTSRHGHHQ